MADQPSADQNLNIITYNKNALNNLRRAVVLGQGQFSLILARVNYQRLQRLLLSELGNSLRLKTVSLPPNATNLREALAAAVRQQAHPAQALMVTGLELVRQLAPLLKAANLGRDELPKTCQCPVVLWVNDSVLQQLNRYAPDLKSFAATPIRFEYPTHSLVSVLTAQANDTCGQILDTDQAVVLSLETLATEPMADRELSFALDQLEHLPEGQEQAISHELIADLLFLQGRNLHQQGDLAKARSYYEDSLTYWQTASAGSVSRAPISRLDKQAVLLLHLGLWWRSHAVLHEDNYAAACERSRQYFEDCLEIFRQQNRPDRLSRFTLALAEVLQKLENWPALSAIARAGIDLHQHDPVRLARDYGYLAEVAIARYKDDPHPHYLSEAQDFAQQALAISEQAIATDPTVPEESLENNGETALSEPVSADNLLQLPLIRSGTEQQTADNSSARATAIAAGDRQTARQVVLRYHRGSYWYLLAIAQQLQNQPAAAIAQLEKARQHTNPHYDLSLYRRILNRLWQLYFDHQHYAQAFEIKLSQRRVENLFGLRAFIGAGQIQPPPAQRPELPLSPTSAATAQVAAQMLAAEIKASGREQDIDALTNRLSQPRYPIIAIHGQSGVGKSSILNAGLVPRLRTLIAEGRTTLPLLIGSYSNWPAQVASALREPTPDPRSDTDWDAASLIDWLATLTREKYQQIVLIFDQFEDFFYEHPAVEDRRNLYTFLRDCLNLPYVKVVLALREDFLHYLLEWDRYADLSIVENDILSKEIRYYLGNFMPKAAERVIRQLTEAAGFRLEEGLVTALVDDLAAETGEIRPIELQVVGAQLQRQNITTLAAYQALGRSPKNQLLKNFLDNVMHDCGSENSSIAHSVLYLLSEGNNRPLKSHSELIEALAAANIPTEPQQLQLVLDILIGSGLVFEVPEVSGVRYQLVHEYLASLVQQQPIDLVEALQAERSRRQLTEEQLQRALAAQSDSLAQTTLARQKTEIAEIRALISVARSLRLSGNGLESLAKALRAARQLHRTNADAYLKMQTALCLDASVRSIREKNELTGHRNWVLAVHCQPTAAEAPQDARTEKIASASEDGTVKLWNGRGELLRTLSDHQAGVLDVCFSPDGQYLASASLDQTVRLYRSNGDFIRRIEQATASVTAIRFSPAAPLLAATYSDAYIRIWNFAGELVQAWEGHEDWARTVAFSPDGQTLATGGEDQSVRLWTVGGESLHLLHSHQGWVRSVAFSPDGQTVISAGDANTLRLWSLEGRKLKTFYGHEDWVRSVAFSPDGQRLASGSDDQTVKIWRLDATVEQTFDQRSSVHSVAWSADGQSVVSGGDDDQVHIWQLEGPPEPILRGHEGIVWSACWQPRPQAQSEPPKLLSAGGDDLIKLWSDRGELLQSVVGHQRGVHSVTWRPDGEYFASASADHSVRIWSGEGELVRELLGHTGAVWQVSYSPGGSRLASVSSDRTLRLWHASGKLLNTWRDHTDTVWHVSFSPNGHHLITASEDNTLRLWHHQNGLMQTLAGHGGGVWCAAFSPDGRFVASGGADGVIRLWPVRWQSQQQITIEPEPLALRGHRDWVRSLSFSPNGEFLASASDDDSVRLWSLLPEALDALNSLGESQLLPPLLGHEGVIWAVDFDGSGDRLVTASADGTVRIWDLRLDVLMKKGCDWLADWLIARPELAQQICASGDAIGTVREG